ncbi:hypothetical protein BD769DRAFT_1321090, partial [Suillus cothurnatus]
MGIDNQDLVRKMEGFAVQGMKGSVKNHQKHVSDKCAEIRDIINQKLHKFFLFAFTTFNLLISLIEELHYICNIVQRYQVVVEGWPDQIPFTNLSQVLSALLDLQMLCNRWDDGMTCWKSLSD